MDTARFVFLVFGAGFLLFLSLSSIASANDSAALMPENPRHEDKTNLLYESPQERENRDRKYKSKFTDKMSLEDKLIEQVPYGGRLKYLWNIADGDVDIHFTGLRFNRKNMGLDYTTSTLPVIGTMDGVRFQLKAGDDNEFSFESRIIPFVGDIEGFSFKGSIGDNSRISARYTIALD